MEKKLQYLINLCGRPLTYAYSTLRQSVAGNLTFWGIVFCNLGTSKPVISKFVTMRQIDTPYSSPCNYDHPNNVSGGQKTGGRKKCLSQKKVSHKNVLIPFQHTCYYTIAGYGFFWAITGPYNTRRCNLVVPADWGWGRGNERGRAFVFQRCPNIY